MRITLNQYKTALRKRYRDLRESLTMDRNTLNAVVDYDDHRIKEMKIIASIARLHGLDIKERE